MGPASLHLTMVASTVPCSLPLGLEARLGGALTPLGFRQQQLWNVCSPSLLSVRALWRLGVSFQIARQSQSAVQSKDCGGAGSGFSAGWFSFRSGHVCAHLLRRACGGWYQGWEALRPGGQQRESCSRSDVHRLTHCASPAFLLSHSSDVTSSPEWKMGQVLGREGLPKLQTGRRWAPAWSTGLSDSHLYFLGS